MAGSPPIDFKGLLGQPTAAATNATNASNAARQRDKLKKATQDFEAVFVGIMLKQMRKSMDGGNALFGNSSEAKLYQDMMDDATAAQMSRTGSFGLGNMLYKKLEPLMPADPAPAAAEAAKAAASAAAPVKKK